MEWETISDDRVTDIVTERAKILGGWLVRFWFATGLGNGQSGMTFVPDPKHKWDGATIDEDEDEDE